MKRSILFALLIVLGLTSCNKDKTFKVNVSLANTDENTMIYLKKIVDDKAVTVDSALFKNEVATLTAPVDDPQMLYTIRIKGMRGSMVFFPENKDVTVVGDVNNPTDVEILGGEAQNKYNEYNKGYNEFNKQIMGLYGQMDEAYKNNDSILMESLNEQGTEIMKQQSEFVDNYIKSNKDHFVGHYILDEQKQDYDVEELKKLVSEFPNESLYTKDLQRYIEKMDLVSVGKPFVDFTLKTNEGQEVNLANYTKDSKLTLVDFWASWCGPCRAENPFVLAAYEKYHDKGFNVLGVSIDQDANAWQKAVQDDKLPWTHVRDIDGKVSEQYLVYYIPSNLLIDENGIIIEKNLRGEKLEEALSSRL